MTHLEHINITVPDPAKTAAWMCALFDWRIRWQGDAIYGGHSIHVGGTDSYIALYAPNNAPLGMSERGARSYDTLNGLNHIAVVVEDLDAVEARVIEAGFSTNNHADYEPGRRFYFDDENGLGVEVVSYS